MVGHIGEGGNYASLYASLNDSYDPPANRARAPPVWGSIWQNDSGEMSISFHLRGFSIEHSANCHTLLSITCNPDTGIPEANNAFVYERLVITGQVPVYAATLVGVLPYLFNRVKDIVIREHEKLRLVGWKAKHLEDLKPQWNRSCRSCNSSGKFACS